MINSFCIETPVPVSGSAQGHLETARPKADVAYCHGKLLCPEELMLYSTTGEKYVVTIRNFYGSLSLWERDGATAARLTRRVRVASLVKSGNPHPTLSRGERVIPPVANPNLTTQPQSVA